MSDVPPPGAQPPGQPETATDRALVRGFGSPALFVVIYTSLASAIYFSLGVVADHALGLTPVVFLAAALLFGLAAMTYVEGASLHQDRAGSTVFARYAFNELISFIAGWAILLDYVILIAVTSFTATNYAAAFYSPLGSGTPELGARARDHRLRRGTQHPWLHLATRRAPLGAGHRSTWCSRP